MLLKQKIQINLNYKIIGDVPLIEAGVDYETLNVTEIQNGSSNGKHIQLMIENTPTPLFDVEDSQQKVKIRSKKLLH